MPDKGIIPGYACCKLRNRWV
jgi:hypothetical protein